MQSEHLVKKLNSKCVLSRRFTLWRLKKLESVDTSLRPISLSGFNVNIHTSCSFSPYSPTLAVYMAYKSGINTVGVCDYGTTAALPEFERACRVLDMNSICGFEVSAQSNTLGECLVALYGIDKNNAQLFELMLADFRDSCRKRAYAVFERFNKRLKKFNIEIDFDKDVLPISDYKKGGTLTLKHVYMAAANKIIATKGQGKAVADFVRNDLCLDIAESEYNLLCDAHDPFYSFDLLSALRNNAKDYAKEIDLPSVKAFTSIAAENGVISSYEYDCPFGWLETENEPEKALAAFGKTIDDAIAEGFNAISLCPAKLSKNTLCAFINLLKERGLLALVTDKTEYPRNHFESVIPTEAKNYVTECVSAVLGNSISIKICHADGMFTNKTCTKTPSFSERLRIFAYIGKKGL